MKDFSLSALVAGFVTVLVGFTSSAVIVFQAAIALHATSAELASWMWALGIGMGITCIGLSLRYRVPVVTAWSTPGAAMLIASNAGVPLSDAIGAFVLVAVLTAAHYLVPRILRLLDRQQVPASFFIPAGSSLLHPQMIPDILARKVHEIGIHGWIHERLPQLNDEKEEQRLLDQSIETLTKAMGKRPVGYRAPSWKFSKWTMGQVKAAGFLYDSSLMASDDPYELLLDGKPTGVVELPIERILDDAPYFGGNADGSMPSVSQVYEVFQSEFDVAYEEGGLYLLTMHPHFIGHRSRVALLERLVQYMKRKPGVWFATHEQIARHVRPMIGN